MLLAYFNYYFRITSISLENKEKGSCSSTQYFSAAFFFSRQPFLTEPDQNHHPDQQ